MALTHSDQTFQSSTTNTAGATTTGSLVSLTGSYETLILARITNGATGPTVACSVIVDVTFDGGSNYREFDRAQAGVANNAVFDAAFLLPASAQGARTRFTGNTGQSVTVEALGSLVTAL